MTTRPASQTHSARFAQLVPGLRTEIANHLAATGVDPTTHAGRVTLETNSHAVPRRAELLLDLLTSHGFPNLAGAQVLDLGCGFGAMSLYFAAAGASVTAVDRHASRIEVGRRLAQANRLPATFVVCDMRDLEPLPSARYDLLVCNNALCYIVPPAERRAALSEALRVTRTGGWLIVRNPSRSHPLDPFTGLPAIHFLPPTGANRLAALLGRRRSYVRLLSPRAARRELERAGFVAVRHVSPAHTPRLRTRFARYQHLIARRSPWSAYP